MKSRIMQIHSIKQMIYISCMIPIRALCSAQDRAVRVRFSNLIIMKIIRQIHPRLLKKQGFLEEANYFKAISKKTQENRKILMTTGKNLLLSRITIIIRYRSTMIIHLMGFLIHKDRQSNYCQLPTTLIQKPTGSSCKFKVKFSTLKEILKKITFISIN